MMKVAKDFKFEACHSLPHLPEGHKCRRMHGHSYRFRVECDGPVDERGFVIDYQEISDAVKPLVERLDHHNLNDHIEPSTAENLAIYIWGWLEGILPLSRVTVFETASTRVVYDGRIGGG